MKAPKKPTVTVTFNADELFLLSDGFGTSYESGGEGNEALEAIGDKLRRAQERLERGPKKRGSHADWWRK